MVSDATKRRLAKRNRIYRKRIPYGMMNFVISLPASRRR